MALPAGAGISMTAGALNISTVGTADTDALLTRDVHELLWGRSVAGCRKKT